MFQSSRAAVIVVAVFWHSSTSSSQSPVSWGSSHAQQGHAESHGQFSKKVPDVVATRATHSTPLIFLFQYFGFLIHSQGSAWQVYLFDTVLTHTCVSSYQRSLHIIQNCHGQNFSLNLPLLTLHQYFPDFLAHSMTLYMYI